MSTLTNGNRRVLNKFIFHLIEKNKELQFNLEYLTIWISFNNGFGLDFNYVVMDRYEQSLYIAEALKVILDNSPEGIVLISPEHKVLAFNKVIKKVLLNYLNKEIVIGHDYRDYVLDAHKDLYLTNFEKASKGKKVVIQNETKSPQGSIWVEFTMNPAYNAEGSFLGVTLIAKNIDEKKRMELELENMVETFQAIIENNTESILLLSVDYKILQFNKPARDRIFTNTNKELKIGADFRDFIYEEQSETFFTSFANAIKGNNYEVEVTMIDGNNEKYWFLSRMFPVYKRNGDLLGISLFALNITDKKKAEVSLKESESKFRSIVEAAPTSMLIVDENMNIVLSNPEVETVFGYTFEELKDKNIKMLIPDRYHDNHVHYQKSYLNNPVPYKMGANRFTPAIKKDGTEIIVEVSLNSFELGNKRHVLTIIQDVTQRVKHEKQILDQLNRLKAIAWQQSHGVRKPVANILGICHLLKTDSDISSEEKDHYIDLLFQATEELDDVIRNIVNYANEH
ncbi:PAS domain S-box protein [Arcicella sp. DC2W]|uniref:histidine kinase n=1 Tax=Arcicella gelida TaxID=2984195 RepID=A0ABU5S5G6_9BACT|nr:PAS domain S-box protein [Arcicella sp. DC2W]MEA5403665.1 PAS domain S-box protein [Arcicella sp. DC2W]